MKYIAYCRKSTDEPDRQILSIEAQVAELKEFATRENLEIERFVVESKTAKEPGRAKFNEVLNFVESGKAGGIISWHPDRLARNSVDGGRIIYLLDTGKLLDLKFPSFWFDNTPQGKFMLSIAFGQSKYYVDNLSENVKRGNRQKLRRGEWPNKAPFGYLNDKGNKKIAVDTKRAKYVRKGFEMFSTGRYSQVDIINFLTLNNIKNKSGHILHKDKIKRILTDPFYYGVMRFNNELYPGSHVPLVSKKLFDKVQENLEKNKKTHTNHKSEFDFLGLIKCGECGSSITAEKHVKNYKRTRRTATYIYYRCTKKQGKGSCSQKYITASSLEKKLRVAVHNRSISTFVAKSFFEWANRDAEKEKSQVKNALSGKLQQLEKTNEKLDTLLEAYLDKVVDEGEYKQKKNKMIENKVLIESQITELKEKGNTWLEPFLEFIKIAKTGAKIARVKNNCHELAVQAKTVGSNLNLKDRKLFVSGVNSAYQFLALHPTTAHSSRLSPDLLGDRDSNPDLMDQNHLAYR